MVFRNMAEEPQNLSGQKILVTGGAGFLGSRIIKELLQHGAAEQNIIAPRSSQFDLRRRENCLAVTKNIDLVIHAAGNVGGIGKNLEYPGTLFYDNATMGIEIIEAARQNGVKKVVCLGTICAYPKYTLVPFKEEDLWNGYPEETNAPYGVAKKMLLVQAQAYRQQFGFNCIYLLPVNMYGPGDNFQPESSHVIPAIIRKIVEAKEKGDTKIEMWGDGTPTREFLYVADAAEGVVLAALRYNKADPVNLGAGREISIKALVEMIGQLLDYKGEIFWNTTKPNGQPRRLLDTSRAAKEFQFKAKTSLETGIKETVDWFLKNRQQL